eukprot:COSAG02_NODE_5152_length_4586_cov_8.120348_3_plen_237_part_00
MTTGANSGKGAFKDHVGVAETHAEHQMKKRAAEGAEEAEETDPYEGLTTKEIAALKAQMGDAPIINKPYEEMTTKEKLYMTFEDPGLNWTAAAISFVITCMILTSTACFIAETMPELAHQTEVSDTCETPPCGVAESTWGTIELCVEPLIRAPAVHALPRVAWTHRCRLAQRESQARADDSHSSAMRLCGQGLHLGIYTGLCRQALLYTRARTVCVRSDELDRLYCDRALLHRDSG